MAYKCGRCGCDFNQKGHIRYHILRKNRCESLLDDLDVDTLLKSIEHQDDEFKHSCAECAKKYRSRQGLLAHIKKHHEESAQPPNLQQDGELNALKNEVLQLRKAMQAMQSSVSNTTHNNNTTTTNNNTINYNIYNLPPPVNRRNFGDETLDHITHDMLTDYTLGMDQGNVDLFTKIHFDPSAPENHNIAHKSLKNKQCFIVENGQWSIVPYRTAMQQAIRKVSGMRFNHSITNQTTDPVIERNVDTIQKHHFGAVDPNSKLHQKLCSDLACRLQTTTENNNPAIQDTQQYGMPPLILGI